VKVPFGNLAADYAARKDPIDRAVSRVLARGWFILGEEGRAFERELADYLGVSEVAACASGTEAIALSLAACGLGAGEEVLVPANTCVPTIAGVRQAGCRPRLMDARPRDLLCGVAEVEAAITPETRAFVVVNLYGGACDGEELARLAALRHLLMIEDCAQSHGSASGGKKTGTFGKAAAFSFYPTKNLGAYGDAGAVATSDPAVAERLRLLRNYGQTKRDFHVKEGWNSRMDELQAAILRAKLPRLDKENARRREIAARYDAAFADLPLEVLESAAGAEPVYHLYPVRLERRDELRQHLAEAGIETLIHYPIPIHLQPAYTFLGNREGEFPVAEKAARSLLSLPIYPTLTDGEVNFVADHVREFFSPLRA
jgi:dTDP-3-amino-3,4,6-trideoxy-alpha-D-glucose transaminase